MTNDEDRAAATQAMADHAKNIIILTESEKFLRTGRIPLIAYDRLAMVYTDDQLTGDTRTEMEERGVPSSWPDPLTARQNQIIAQGTSYLAVRVSSILHKTGKQKEGA